MDCWIQHARFRVYVISMNLTNDLILTPIKITIQSNVLILMKLILITFF